MNKRALFLLAFVGLFGAAGWIGYTLHFTTFMLYDDEGYVLLTLRDFGRHGGLYDQVFSQYGPFFYLYYDGLQRVFNFEWTNTTGRWITLCNWLGTATCCALLVHRARGWGGLTLFTFVGVFGYEWIMIHEPMHPGSTITLGVSLAALLGCECLRAGRLTWFAAILGAACAAIALVKINVGAFLVFSTSGWLLLASPVAKQPALRLAIRLIGVLLPVALMRTLLSESWIQIFVLVSGCSIVAALLAIEETARWQEARRSTWLWFIGSGVVTTLLTCVCLWLRGTSLSALWEGVFLAPLKHPTVYAFPLNWRPGVVFVAISGLALTWWVSRKPGHELHLKTIACTRLVVAALFQLLLLPQFSAAQAAVSMGYGLPLVGVFAWPLRKEGAAFHSAVVRAWLGAVLVFQALHAYPVAGSQMNWGTFLWVPLMLLGVQDAVEYLFEKRPQALRHAKASVSGIAVLMLGTVLWTLGGNAYHYRQNGEFLEVPGAEKIQLPEQVASAIRIITENARVHGDMLFSLPGAYSLNLWSGVNTPTLANVTHWFSLLTPAQQEEYLVQLKAAKRPVFVVQHNILAALIDAGFRPQSPVLDYVRLEYHRAFAVEGYSFWVRNDRVITPLSTGTLELLDSPQAGRRARIEFNLTGRPGRIAAIELWNVSESQWHVATLNSVNATLDVAPLRLDNRLAGERRNADWPLELIETTRLGIEFTAPANLPTAAAIEAVLLDETGQNMGYARVLPPNGLTLPAFNQTDAGPPAAN